MRVLAALTLTAVAVAARSAGAKDDEPAQALSIKQINYGSTKTREPEDPVKTEICLDEGALTDADVVIVTVTIDGQETLEPLVGNVEEKENCVTVEAPMPQNTQSVEYAMVVQGNPSMLAGVKFTFEDIAHLSQITCDEVTLKVSDDGQFVDGDGCKTVNRAVDGKVTYCDEDAITTLAPNQGDLADAKSLTYKSGNKGLLTLEGSGVYTNKDVVVVYHEPEEEKQHQVYKADQKGNVILKSFVRGTAKYTACPVVPGFTAYSITDLDIIGTYGAVNAGTNNYYQFGFNYMGAPHKKFIASAPAVSADPNGKKDGDASVIINCENLDELLKGDPPSTRCYGYLQGGDGPLTLSYYDDAKAGQPTNSIIVESTDILQPEANLSE